MAKRRQLEENEQPSKYVVHIVIMLLGHNTTNRSPLHTVRVVAILYCTGVPKKRRLSDGKLY